MSIPGAAPPASTRTGGAALPNGTLPGVEAYRELHHCSACDRTWAGPEKSRKAALCPDCLRPTAGAVIRRVVLRTVRREEMRLSKTTHLHEPDRFGGRRSESYTQHAVPVEYEVSVQVHKCEHCSHDWYGAEEEHRVG